MTHRHSSMNHGHHGTGKIHNNVWANYTMSKANTLQISQSCTNTVISITCEVPLIFFSILVCSIFIIRPFKASPATMLTNILLCFQLYERQKKNKKNKTYHGLVYNYYTTANSLEIWQFCRKTSILGQVNRSQLPSTTIQQAILQIEEHDGNTTCKHSPHYWCFVKGIPVGSIFYTEKWPTGQVSMGSDFFLYDTCLHLSPVQKGTVMQLFYCVFTQNTLLNKQLSCQLFVMMWYPCDNNTMKYDHH